jgi:nicotinamidase-related amidase
VRSRRPFRQGTALRIVNAPKNGGNYLFLAADPWAANFHLAEACNPRRLALLIYDMQVGICQQISCGPAITEACKRLRDRCRAAGVPIAYSRHLSLPTHWLGPFQTRMAMAWQRIDDPASVMPWFLRGAPGFELVPELAPRDDEFVFDKLAMSAFEGTPLQFALRDRGITTLAICGIALESRN